MGDCLKFDTVARFETVSLVEKVLKMICPFCSS